MRPRSTKYLSMYYPMGKHIFYPIREIMDKHDTYLAEIAV